MSAASAMLSNRPPLQPGDDALIRPDAAVTHFVGQVRACAFGQRLLRVLLPPRARMSSALCEELVDRVRVRRVERQGDHRTQPSRGRWSIMLVVISRLRRGAALCSPPRGRATAKKPLRLLVRLPDGGQAGRLGRHDVDAVAEVDGQARDAGAGKLQHAVVDKAALQTSP